MVLTAPARRHRAPQARMRRHKRLAPTCTRDTGSRIDSARRSSQRYSGRRGSRSSRVAVLLYTQLPSRRSPQRRGPRRGNGRVLILRRFETWTCCQTSVDGDRCTVDTGLPLRWVAAALAARSRCSRACCLAGERQGVQRDRHRATPTDHVKELTVCRKVGDIHGHRDVHPHPPAFPCG